MPELIDCRELAARLKVSDRTVRDWSLKGWIPFYRLGGLYRYDFDEVFATLHRPATKEATPYRRSDHEKRVYGIKTAIN